MKRIKNIFFISLLIGLSALLFAGCAKNGEKLFPVDENFIDNYVGSIEIIYLPHGKNQQILITDKTEIKTWINEFNTVSLTFYPQKWNLEKLQFEASIELPANEDVIFVVKLLDRDGYSISVDGGLKASFFSIYNNGMVQKTNSIRSYHTGMINEDTKNKLLALF